jgi:hypothetical protein
MCGRLEGGEVSRGSLPSATRYPLRIGARGSKESKYIGLKPSNLPPPSDELVFLYTWEVYNEKSGRGSLPMSREISPEIIWDRKYEEENEKEKGIKDTKCGLRIRVKKS